MEALGAEGVERELEYIYSLHAGNNYRALAHDVRNPVDNDIMELIGYYAGRRALANISVNTPLPGRTRPETVHTLPRAPRADMRVSELLGLLRTQMIECTVQRFQAA